MRTRHAAALALLMLTAVSCHHAFAAQPAATAPADWPATRAGELARGWVTAFSTGEDAMRAFLDTSMAPASLATRNTPARVEKYRALRDQYGKLQLDKVLESTPGEVTVRLIDSEAKSHEFGFAVQTEAPYKLLSVSIREPMHGLHGMLSGLHNSH
jgi:hypothetical protein